MIYNIGIDIEEIKRFKRKDNRLFEKIFTKKELENIKQSTPNTIAGIFCAKEAIIKACSPLMKIDFTEIEIFRGKSGLPFAVVKKLKKTNKNLKISISHSRNYAVSVAVLSKGGLNPKNKGNSGKGVQSKAK